MWDYYYKLGLRLGCCGTMVSQPREEVEGSPARGETIWSYQFRIVLIGDSTVGKSALLRRFSDGDFLEVSRFLGRIVVVIHAGGRLPISAHLYTQYRTCSCTVPFLYNLYLCNVDC